MVTAIQIIYGILVTFFFGDFIASTKILITTGVDSASAGVSLGMLLISIACFVATLKSKLKGKRVSFYKTYAVLSMFTIFGIIPGIIMICLKDNDYRNSLYKNKSASPELSLNINEQIKTDNNNEQIKIDNNTNIVACEPPEDSFKVNINLIKRVNAKVVFSSKFTIVFITIICSLAILDFVGFYLGKNGNSDILNYARSGFGFLVFLVITFIVLIYVTIFKPFKKFKSDKELYAIFTYDIREDSILVKCLNSNDVFIVDKNMINKAFVYDDVLVVIDKAHINFFPNEETFITKLDLIDKIKK